MVINSAEVLEDAPHCFWRSEAHGGNLQNYFQVGSLLCSQAATECVYTSTINIHNSSFQIQTVVFTPTRDCLFSDYLGFNHSASTFWDLQNLNIGPKQFNLTEDNTWLLFCEIDSGLLTNRLGVRRKFSFLNFYIRLV